MTSKIDPDNGIELTDFAAPSSKAPDKSSAKIDSAALRSFHELHNEGLALKAGDDATDYEEKLKDYHQRLLEVSIETRAAIDAAHEEAIEKGRSRSSTELALPAPSSDYQISPQGLPNFGNTCFANSVLQLLFHTPGIDAILDNENIDPNRNEFRKTLKELRAEYLRGIPNNPKVAELLRRLWASPVLNGLDMTRQQDARQFFDIVYEVLNIKGISSSIKIFDPRTNDAVFGNNVNEHIALAIPKNSPTLQKCWDGYLKTETLETPLDDHANCTAKRDFFKGEPPASIQFSVKRNTPSGAKIDTRIQGVDQPIQVPFSNDQGEEISRQAYQVDTVVCHTGIAGSGHYFILAKTTSGWKECNDNHERFLSDKDALAIIEKQGYIFEASKI